jgi:MFS transporter, AAHS family, 3-hydroxyphenylpropionic acid transporter
VNRTSSHASSESHRARLTLWMCFGIAVLEGYDLQAMAIAGPAVRTAMNLDPREVGMSLSASLMGLAVGAALGGRMADSVGRKRVLIASLAALGLMTVVTALTTQFATLFIARVLAGLAMGGVMPNLIAISSIASLGERATTKVAAMICGLPAGGVVVALGGQALIERWGWQSLFWLGGVLTTLAIPLVRRALIEPTVLAERVSVRAPAWRTTLFGEGRSLATLLLWVAFVLTLAIFSTVAGWAPTLVVDKGLSPAAGYGSLLAINVGGILGALVLSASCDRWGIRGVMVVSYAAMAVSLWLFSSSSQASSVMPLAGLVGFWLLGAQCALYGISPRLYPPSSCSTGVGSAVAAGRIGSILGPILAGLLMGHGTSANELIEFMAPLAGLAGAALLALSWAAPHRLVGKSV